MLRFRLKELIAERQFQDGKRLKLEEIAESTGIHRTTLSKLQNVRGYNTTTETLDRLCNFFQCEIGDLVQWVPEKPD